jgi:hypothetical protein
VVEHGPVGVVEGPPDGGLQLLDHRPQPTGGLGPATSQGPVGAGYDPAGVGQLRLGQPGDLPGDLEHDLFGLVGTRPHRPSDFRARRWAARRRSRTRVRVAPPAAWTPFAVVASLSTARASSPRSVG